MELGRLRTTGLDIWNIQVIELVSLCQKKSWLKWSVKYPDPITTGFPPLPRFPKERLWELLCMTKCLGHKLALFSLAHNSIISFNLVQICHKASYLSSVLCVCLPQSGLNLSILILFQMPLSLCWMSHLLFPASANRPSAFYWQVMLPHST